jgi:hypothetical protein
MSDSDAHPEAIEDEDLPDDLVPADDNPLAEGIDPDEMPEDLDVLGGKDAEQSEESPDAPSDEETDSAG